MTDRPTADVEQIIADAFPSPFVLAGEAGTFSPDSETSAGAQFLGGIASDVAERITYRLKDGEPFDLDDFNDEDRHEIADAAVPIYTAVMWRSFTDLGAWREDPTEIGFDGSDMEQGAKICLYMIAERLAMALAEHVAEVLETDDEDGEEV